MISSSFKLTSTASGITSTAATIGTAIVIRGWQSVVNLEIENSGSAALTDFLIELQDHPDGEFYDFLSGTDYATGTDDMLFCTSTVPNTLAASGKAHVIFRTWSAYAMRFQATCATTTTVKVRGSYSGAR